MLDPPNLKFNKTELKNEIKKATYSFCYVCPAKYSCNSDTKRELRCMDYQKAKKINEAIDFAYEVIREIKNQKKIAQQKGN